ncbi:hypothetical protein BH11MYX1_BH11MYX1_08490 [soil metagenome]
MRLYRGLKNPYRPELVHSARRSGTNFTDCPATALRYAQGSRGVLIVVDINVDYDENAGPTRVTKELWLERQASRFMIWGRFDDVITTLLAAKDLRTRLRRERLRNAPRETKTFALRAVIEQDLRERALRSKLASRSEFVDRTSSRE